MMKITGFLFIFLMCSVGLFAQEPTDSIADDSETKEWEQYDSLYYQEPEIKIVEPDSIRFKKKDPSKAALFSAILPGAGQAYNEKYWKIPVVYFVTGSLVYWADYNNKQYKRYLTAYVALNDDDETTVDEFGGAVSSENLLYYKNSFRRSRDISFLLIGAAYLLNIVDASVDAHFSDYDVGEDLSMHIRPVVMDFSAGMFAPGVSLAFRFK